MNLIHQEITLDVNDNKNTVVVNAHQGDAGTRFIDVTLTQCGEIISMSNTFTATAKASLFGMVKGLDKCEVDTSNNKIIVELTDTMLDTPGRLNCEITLSEGEQIITSQIFTVDVTESVVDESKEIAKDADLAKLQRAIFLVGELSRLENLEELDNKATTAYNRFAQYSGEDVDLNVSDITDTLVVNLYNCNVTNAPVEGKFSGTVVSLSQKGNGESYIVQFLIMRNNYTYKRNYTTSNGWTSWVKVADDMSQYLKTEDLQEAILSDTPSDTTAYSSNKVNALLKEKIDTVAIRGADMKATPTYLTLAQKEGGILALYCSNLFNDDTPSHTTTFTGAKLDEMLYDKEDNSNKVTTGSPSYKEAQYPSLAYLEKYFYNKTETDNLLGDKAEKSEVDNNTFDLSMLMSSLKRTVTGTSLVNLTNTAQNGILKVTANGGVTCKNKNIFEDILNDSIRKFNCNVSYDNGTYTVEYTGDGTNTFFFGNIVEVGNKYNVALGKKLKYYKDLSIRINCDKLTRSGCYITYFNSEDVSLQLTNYSTNTTFKIDDVEGAEYFTMRIGFDWNNGVIATGDIVTFSVQIEYGDTVSDYVVPQSNTDNLAYEDVTNIVGDGEITVEYVPSLKKPFDNI
ncbi:MAG: pyocin knob domain-containing protein [Ruminococcus sp.]|nr:pyocin knob domain-containing protein [Ruminococcus sp.]